MSGMPGFDDATFGVGISFMKFTAVQNAGNVSYQHGDVQVTFAQAKLQ